MRCYGCPQKAIIKGNIFSSTWNCSCTADKLIEMNYTDPCPSNQTVKKCCTGFVGSREDNEETNFDDWYWNEQRPTVKCIPKPTQTPMETPQETLARTPKETAKETLARTLFFTPQETPIRTLLFTPFETPTTGLIESKILYQEPNDPYLYFIIPIVVLSLVNIVLLILYCRRKKTTQETSEESETSQIEPRSEGRITRSQSFPNLTITIDSYMADEDPFSQDFHSDPDSEVIEN